MIETATMQWEAGGHGVTAKLTIGVRLFFEREPKFNFHRSEVYRAAWRMHTPQGPVELECVLTPEAIAKMELEFERRRLENDRWLGSLVKAICLGAKSKPVETS